MVPGVAVLQLSRSPETFLQWSLNSGGILGTAGDGSSTDLNLGAGGAALIAVAQYGGLSSAPEPDVTFCHQTLAFPLVCVSATDMHKDSGNFRGLKAF